MPASNAARLPLGMHTFSEVRELRCAYVDKTPLAVKLAESGKMYFLVFNCIIWHNYIFHRRG